MVEHGITWRRRARQSLACNGMAWHCVVKHCITKHCNAKHGIAQRRRTQHRTACHGMAPGFCGGQVDRLRENWAGLESRLHGQLPGLPEKLPTRRLCLQHRLLKADSGRGRRRRRRRGRGAQKAFWWPGFRRRGEEEAIFRTGSGVPVPAIFRTDSGERGE